MNHQAGAGSSEERRRNARARLEWHQEAASQEVGTAAPPAGGAGRAGRGWGAGRRLRQQRLKLRLEFGRLRLQRPRHHERRAVGAATVAATTTSLGTILVDGSGRILYLFEKDQPNQSACAGACGAAWPVDQTSGTPKAGSSVKASLLGSIKRSDGTTQVTYNKHPLYYFARDSQAGQHNGQGVDAFGAEWYVLTPAGKAVGG